MPSFHITLLENELKLRKERNPRYSLRAFASFLKTDPSTLSRLLNFKQDLSVELALQVIRKLKLEDPARERFIASVADEKYLQTLAALCDGAEAVNPHSRLSEIAHLVPTLLWCAEPDGRRIWYNSQWSEYTGQTSEEAADWGWLEAIHPDDRERTERTYRSTLAAGEPVELEHRIRSASGNHRWFLVRARAQTDGANGTARIYGASMDIQRVRTVSGHVERRRTESSAAVENAQ